MMLDIHSHIIPGVDDGSPDMETSINMLKECQKSGITDIILTPHYAKGAYEEPVDVLREKYNELKEAAKKENININLYLGQEIYYTKIIKFEELLSSGRLLSMNDTKIVLLEFSLLHKPNGFEDAVYDLLCNGYQVIIAHAERYSWITLDEIRYLKNEGAYIQVNANSVAGIQTTMHDKRLCKKILKLGLVDYIASDLHSFRRLAMKEAFKAIEGKYEISNDPSIFNI